jgi:protein-S-isoprenylcysteine O-methyltransferase Ste14
MKTALRIIAATGVFAAIHSTFASRRAKHTAKDLVGARTRNGLYRVVYIGQSLGTFALLAAYIRRQPGAVIYELTPPASVPMRAGQLVGLVVAAQAARKVGLGRISGATSLGQWLRAGEVEPEPEAQGPALRDGEMDAGGPFRYSRHPLNFWPLAVLWLTPRMTTNRAAFNAAATVYLVIGSIHEELRLREAYGERYESYESANIPFYIPALQALLPRPKCGRTVRRSKGGDLVSKSW